MKSVIVPILIAAALLSVQTTSASGQWPNYPTPGIPRLPDGKPNLFAPAPRTPDGKPDLSGVWHTVGAEDGYDYNVARDLKPGDVQPSAEALQVKRTKDFGIDSPLTRCLPNSIPFLNNFRSLVQIVQTPALIVILYEYPNSPHRTIYMDGRELPKDPNPMWLGYSVAHWEQDTLVINSAGFNDKGWLDFGGLPQTETLRLTERFRRRDFGHLGVEMTFEDPKTFTKPFSLRIEKALAADTEPLEDFCENERDHVKLTRGAQVAGEVLAKYAGTYDLAGRDIFVSVAGDQLIVDDSANPLHRLYTPSSDTVFLSIDSNPAIAIEFVKDGRGIVTHFTRTKDGKVEKAIRKGDAPTGSKK